MNYSIRSCATLDELAACVRIQKAIWGYAESETYPLRLFVNLQKLGGHVLGAFAPDGEMVGFVASMPAWRGRQRYFYSLSLGVMAGHENQGLGRRLKLAQRKRALDEGVRMIEWTFDPMRAKNAFFNLIRLGAVCRRYHPDYYGLVESRMQLGLPSDRLIAEWPLDSPRVKRAIRGGQARNTGRPPAATVEIPADVGALLEADWERARDLQLAVREQLTKLLRRGLVITGFEKIGDTARYLLESQ